MIDEIIRLMRDERFMTQGDGLLALLNAGDLAATAIETLRAELAATKARLGEAVEAPRFVTLGAGKVVSVWGHYEGKPAVFLRPLANGEIGKEGCPARDEHKHSPDSLHPREVVLILEGNPSAFLEDLHSARAFLTKQEPSQ